MRRADNRPQRDDEKLAQVGIHRYESKRLRLYSDIRPEIARTLPPVIDAVYDAWVSYFGPLPPNPERSEYQITGYVMADRAVFREAGLLPENLSGFQHGRHRDSEFWMDDQEFDYYRTHLLIHEATHCFMTVLRSMRDVPPAWYMEGMAEHFGAHVLPAEPGGTIRFRVIPHNKTDFAGFGRITLVRRDIAAGRFHTLDQVLRLKAPEYFRDEAYAWSWALCYFLDTHPRCRDRFRQLGDCLTFNAFEEMFDDLFRADLPELRTEWALFAHNLQESYDVERTAIEFASGSPLTGPRDARTAEIAADRGWQSGGVLAEAGADYRIMASGQFTLAQEPRPWLSEPQGISFRYFGGRPLGELHAAIRASEPAPNGAERMLQVMPIGREATIRAPVTGTIYFRLSDSWSELADNTGSVQVTIERVGDGEAPSQSAPSHSNSSPPN